MADNALETMTADELYALAQQREQEEQEQQKAENRRKIDELRARKKELSSQYKKDLAAIETEIEALSGRSRARSRSGVNLTDRVYKIVADNKEIATRDIKAELERQGVQATNLSQTLAYLKRQGRVISPSRSIYQLAS
jgi:predicted DCC family thiol-disulfide oxidoreductase YuxK